MEGGGGCVELCMVAPYITVVIAIHRSCPVEWLGIVVVVVVVEVMKENRNWYWGSW